MAKQKCSICKLSLDIGNFYFRKDRNEHRKNCKKCVSLTCKKYREGSNRQRILDQKLEWQRENKDKKAIISKRYYLANRSKIISYTKFWKREKRSLQARLVDNYRGRIIKAIKRRSNSSSELLGCDVDYLMKHLENMFKPGMSWDNYGKWHVDHIKPCVAFDLQDKSQLFECFNYKNLQPLWAYDNRSKGGKYE